MAFVVEMARNSPGARIWVCKTPEEEDALTDVLGPVEPGAGVLRRAERTEAEIRPHLALDSAAGIYDVPEAPDNATTRCRLAAHEVPSAWTNEFPSGAEIIALALARTEERGLESDRRLITRRDCEYILFQSLEDLLVLPRIKKGFTRVQEFVDFANSVTNRRKSRAGRSLELHLKAIFDEEHVRYSHNEITERNNAPDFLFPSVENYRNRSWPEAKLRMLAAKTTCKDRWRQILEEADRIPIKHLVTLQEGVSENQFQQMTRASIVLVVPSSLHPRYPKSIRAHLMSLNRFIEELHSI